MCNHSETSDNKTLVQQDFDRWPAQEVFRSSSPLTPAWRRHSFPMCAVSFADGDMVITLFDASATARDGRLCRSTYTWYFGMKDKKLVDGSRPCCRSVCRRAWLSCW